MNERESQLNPFSQFSRTSGPPLTREGYEECLQETRERIAVAALGEEAYAAWLRDRLGLPEGAPLPSCDEIVPSGMKVRFEPCELPPGYHWYCVRFNVEREKGEQRGFRVGLAAPNPMMAARRARKEFLRRYGHTGLAAPDKLFLQGFGYCPLIPYELGRVKRIRVTSAVVDEAHHPMNGVLDPHGQEAPD
jgi:hypothetical protein